VSLQIEASFRVPARVDVRDRGAPSLRIALVAEDYYPQLGGVPEHVHHLASELIRVGHEATIITSWMGDGHADPPYVRRVGRSRVIYSNGGVARVTTGWHLTDRLARVFRDGAFDVVHVHGGLAPTLGILAPRAAARAHIPVVATFHSWFPRSVGYRLFRSPLQQMLERHAAAIAVSSSVVDAMSRYFRTHWHVIPNGVDIDWFHGNGRHHRASGDAPHLLFLGRLEPRNGLATLLAAMPAIVARFPDAVLTVAGDGPFRGRYEREAAPLGTHVRFVGSVLGDRPDRYRAADLYLCPTRRASFGVTLLEAMACGTPMIVSDLPAFRDVVGDDGPAVLAPMNDAAAWAEAAIALLADPARRRTMSCAGRRRAEAFRWSTVAERVLAVYRHAVRC